MNKILVALCFGILNVAAVSSAYADKLVGEARVIISCRVSDEELKQRLYEGHQKAYEDATKKCKALMGQDHISMTTSKLFHTRELNLCWGMAVDEVHTLGVEVNCGPGFF